MITRFSPSPTGYLHIGGARTALFNWLASKKFEGKFILRIEDTDKARSTIESVQQILNDLKWLGIMWDEGPDVEGENSPYFQSQRNNIYLQYAKKLIKAKKAYRCFCSEDELEKERERQIKETKTYKYNQKCRNLTQDEIDENLENNKKHSIRFLVPENHDILIKDTVKGDVTVNTLEIGDFILIKPDGGAVYNFAVVVDDALMKITHVLRGDDHLSNTPKQILLYEAMDFPLPIFGHLSMIHGKDGKKLSKRKCAVAVGEYKSAGFLNKAVINYLAMLGWAFPQDKEIMTVDELIQDFNITKFSKSASIFDIDKLTWINSQHIKKLDAITLFKETKPFIEKKYFDLFEEEFLIKMVFSVKDYLNKLNEINNYLSVYDDNMFEITKESAEIIEQFDIKSVATVFLNELNNFQDLSGKNLMTFVKSVQKETGIKGKDFYKVLRIIITGKTEGLELNFLFELIPLESLRKRVSSFIN